jgi:hypothetical protein
MRPAVGDQAPAVRDDVMEQMTAAAIAMLDVAW